MAKAILILNAQNDFVSAYIEGKAIIENIAEYVKRAAEKEITVFNIQDTHYDLPRQRAYPWPYIGSYGHDIAPQLAEALYDTRQKYNDIFYLMKVKPCAEEVLNRMTAFEEIIIMGFRGADVRETARAIKEVNPNAKIKLTSGGITLDWTNEKMLDEGWELIAL